MSKIFRVFIASPGDVEAERDLADKAVANLSRKLEPIFQIRLSTVRWEDFAPIASASPDEVVQDRILKRLEACAIFVGILYKRYGTDIDQSRHISGTEAEFKFAIKHRDRMKILTYFRQHRAKVGRRLSREVKDQLKRRDELKEKLRNAGLPFQEYKSASDFADRIVLDLLETVLEATTEVRRQEYLRAFFRLGLSDKESEPSIMIACPAIHKHHGSSARADYNWRDRLSPNVVYEDFKAIQKIESALRCIGVVNYSTVTTLHPKLTLRQGNRIWICLPRNEPGQRQLESIGRRAWFRFEGDDSNTRCIVWKPPWLKPKTRGIRIRSPLAKYLAEQRPRGRKPWNPEFGNIFARDFAVIARFRSEEGVFLEGRPPFYHYFMAGIRGLGTWGIGWYIDRRPDDLARLAAEQGNGEVQAVLQVTFENYRIQEVIDVSKCDQRYFNRQRSDKYIREMVERHRHTRKPPS